MKDLGKGINQQNEPTAKKLRLFGSDTTNKELASGRTHIIR